MARTILPCCLFPTNIVIIDDDEEFLNSLALSLHSKGISAKTFVEPQKALSFINTHNVLDLDKSYNTSVDISDHSSVYETKTDLSAIVKQILSESHFKQLSVVISDYHMPFMNGLQLFDNIKSSSIKKVLLTAVAGDDTAVAAFNDGTIDKFISKGERYLSDKLTTLIKDLQFTLFAEQSFNVYKLYENAIENKPFLHQKAFLNWFRQLLSDYQITEFYLITEFSMIDFLMVSSTDDKKTYHWLSIRDDDDMYALYDIAKDHGSIENILSKLKAKAVIPIVMNEKDSSYAPDKWGKILNPAEQIHFDNTTLYYALINGIELTQTPLNIYADKSTDNKA